MTKRLPPERIVEIPSSTSVWLTPHVTLAELLGHIEAIEAELEERLHKETHEHIDTRIELEHAEDVIGVLEKELAEAKATIAQLAKENRESDDSGEIALTWRQRAEQAESQVEVLAEDGERLSNQLREAKAEIARLKSEHAQTVDYLKSLDPGYDE